MTHNHRDPFGYYIRPDGVMRTGVVEPLVGFNPSMAVQDNAASFTRYPYNQTFDTNSLATALNGFGAPATLLGPRLALMGGLRGPVMLMDSSGLGLFQRIKLWIQAKKAAKQAAKFTAVAVVPVVDVAAPTAPAAAINPLPPMNIPPGQTGLTPNGPAYAMGPQINPMPYQSRAMLALLSANQQPEDWSANALDVIANRWNGRAPR